MNNEISPKLAAVVVHWRDEGHLEQLLDVWPRDPAFELLVVDNSCTLDGVPHPARLVTPSENLGFAGGVNRALASIQAPIFLILNPDARPEEGALEHLVEAFADFPEAAGIVPALTGSAGEPQFRWQLQPLPTPWTLIRQTFLFAGERGPARPPSRGTPVAQPAAAALALRPQILRDLGGLDEGFYPAWFEDVDLGRRLADAGHRLLYDPETRFVHAGGATVGRLGYGPFLWIYYRGLCRYLAKHHGGFWSALARVTLFLGMLGRIVLLPLRRPRRVASRRHAVDGLAAVILGAVSGWRKPVELARRYEGRVDEHKESR